jgi:hypothetical protein
MMANDVTTRGDASCSASCRSLQLSLETVMVLFITIRRLTSWTFHHKAKVKHARLWSFTLMHILLAVRSETKRRQQIKALLRIIRQTATARGVRTARFQGGK